jgi:NAD-dependent SIR2 family protein deacetylase
MRSAPTHTVPSRGTDFLDLLRGRRIVVLAGAGCSTESGIPDYRGPDGRLRARKPIQYNDFVRSTEARTRYWARSAVGWRRMSSARPNPAHFALARLEAAASVRGVITQNVDGLHHAAGSRRVVELHGSLAHVRCLACGERTSRAELQERLATENTEWLDLVEDDREAGAPRAAPDGDADLIDHHLDRFRVPECLSCGGVLKPDVVFFGENVPSDRVREAWALFEEGEVLLVVGSSLMVFSGRRFVYRAAKHGVPIGIVNLGPTRADDLAAARLEGRLGEVLPRLADELIRA